MQEITIKDVARKCGVGIGTVSRAINNHPGINAETRKKVLAVIEETGYIPNNSARNLKRIDARCIAVLIKGIENSFFGAAIREIEAQAKQRKYTLVLQHVDACGDEVETALELIKEKRLKGIIFLGGSFAHDREKLNKIRVPFIFSTIGIDEKKEKNRDFSQAAAAEFSVIAVDDRAESKKMVQHLIDLGHREIAIITENAGGSSVGRLRLEGYKEALAEGGIPFREQLVGEVEDQQFPYSIENGYKTAGRLIHSGVPFTALFAVSDFFAMGACRALHEAGRRIPEDVSVAGFDGIPAARYFIPSLTTISQPITAMAKETAALLLDVIEGTSAPRHQIFPARLIQGESTAPVRRFC